MMLSDEQLSALDQCDLPHSRKLELGSLLREVRNYRALRPFVEERAAYPMATWGEKELARLVLLAAQ
jgi:hypothetical protein